MCAPRASFTARLFVDEIAINIPTNGIMSSSSDHHRRFHVCLDWFWLRRLGALAYRGDGDGWQGWQTVIMTRIAVV